MSLSIQNEFKIEEIKLIVGLGNIGKKYKTTRHNAGFIFADRLADKFSAEFKEQSKFYCFLAEFESAGDKVLLAKPTTYMNDSGKCVQKLCTFYKIAPKNTVIVFDDLDIELGSTKIQFGKGPKVHNGIKSVTQSIGTDDYWRFRVGVDNRTPKQKAQISGMDFVLMNMDVTSRNTLNENLGEVISLF